mmetsp:Transcript_76330/g.220565  ORF Transcript_76330/g.220565 Transcript_76330/m.220565 type:complete len:180 (+) Transcript_76330:122-661(+)
MAFIFRREGDHIKHRIHMERMGIQPWIEDFKYRVVGWHYNYYMGPKARSAVMSNQAQARKMEESMRKRSMLGTPQAKGDKTAHIKVPYSHMSTKHFTWTTCIPRIAPQRKSSNPFCPVTPNRTGWQEYVEQLDVRGAVRVQPPKDRQHRYQYTVDPKPKGKKHVVSGTDDTVPVMPNQD